MKLKKGSIIIGLILVVPVLATIFPIITKHSEKDIVRMTMETALVKQEIPDYEMLKTQHDIILSTENIDPKIIPALPGVNLIMLSQSEIQEKADKEGDFLYLHFKKVQVGMLKSSVSLDNVWIRSKDSKKVYESGGGLTLWFYNVLGKWIESPARQSWIS